MITNRFHRLCIIFGLSAVLIREALASTPVTPNLLVNGDAEAQRCTQDWTAQTSVPGWRVTRGAVSVLCYSAFNYTGEVPVLPDSGAAGEALFTAPGTDTAMEQTVDVSAAAAAIDHGTVGFKLSDWIGIFPAGTAINNMTKKAARTVGYWLYTPGGGGEAAPCGEAEAYTSELTPGTTYQVLLFTTASNGTKQIGSSTEFTVTPALPH